jgi:sulfite exporter TauE/SafE
MVSSYYIQVLSLGLVWTFFHCSGMCGPLVAGLTSRSDDQGSRARRLFLRARRVLAYQGGRALTYAAMGTTAGLAGAAFEGVIRDLTAMAGFVVAPLFLVLGIWKLAGRSLGSGAGTRMGSFAVGALRKLRAVKFLRGDFLSSMATGLVMGLLPCVLMFWVLGIAASTASPLHGAGVMVLLVALTTPTLLAAGCAASIWRIRWSERFVGGVLIFSAVWMALVALAANGIIDHVQFSFRLLGEPYMVMLF